MPFLVEERSEVLWLTLDTPGAPVNIFNRATAAQTLELMRSVDSRRVRAVVIRSAKPNSFINGAGVLLVTYVKTPEAVEEESRVYRQAYAAIRACPVPTVAAIEGSCWGCGLELALQCDHRIASGGHDTSFRLTEMSDYVEVPLFGSTRLLPDAVGMQQALDLLLWDARWGARQALREGLLQEVAPADGFSGAVDAFVRRVLRGQVPSLKTARSRLESDPFAVLSAARARVEDIPPLYHRTFRDTLDLLELTAHGEVGAEHERRGLLATTASTTHPSAKAAYGMFHLRQTAATLAAWKAPAGEHGIALSSAAPDAARLFGELRERQPLTGVRILPAPAAGSRAARAPGPTSPPDPIEEQGRSVTVLVGPGEARAPEDVEVSPPLGAPSAAADSLCWPVANRPFVELRAARGARSALGRALQAAGFQVALSQGNAYGSHQLLGAMLAALAAAVTGGESPNAVDRALRELGLFRRAPALIGALGPGAAAELAARASGAQAPRDLDPALERLAQPADFRAGRDAPELVDELLLWLLPVALDGSFSHPSFVDLAARELLDFPVARLSLCRHLAPDRVRFALERAPARLPARIRARAQAYAAAGKGFYR
ncbi:MAG TPA: enoyl-CoA hydratase/isomerase family protein [Myxococcaceae bacterium]